MSPLRRVSVTLALTGLLAFAPGASAAEPGSSPLRIHQAFDANFPPALLAEGITSGHVRALVHVDADGRLVDHLILAYTHPALADELTLSLREWTFEPARERGEPVGTRSEIHFNFEAKGAVLTLTAIDTVTALGRWLPDQLTSLICSASQLDRPLAAVQTVAPVHPGARFRNVPPTGDAVIDFYIDATGRPRMPAILRCTNDAFGLAALDALAQWRFLPPTRRQQPVCVHARQLFQFTAPLPAPPGDA